MELLSAMRSVEDRAKARLHLTGGSVELPLVDQMAAGQGSPVAGQGPGTQMTMQLEGSNVLEIDRLRGDL